MYIYGGRGGIYSFLSDMWRFDLTNNIDEVSQNNTGEGPGILKLILQQYGKIDILFLVEEVMPTLELLIRKIFIYMIY